MEIGSASSGGISSCSAASTVVLSCSKKSGIVIASVQISGKCTDRYAKTNRQQLIIFIFRIKRFRHNLAIRLLQQNLDAPFRLFQLLLALARKFYALFKEPHRFVQRQIRALQAFLHFLEPRKRFFEVAPL